MCGRYVMATPASDLVALFEVDQVGDALPEPSWNVAPTTLVPIVVEPAPRDDTPPARRLEGAVWGLLPPWAKQRSDAARAFNARSESVLEKPTFRDAVQRRRAIVPTDGYYEWQRKGKDAVPHFIHADGVLGFAGVYSWWKSPDGEWVLSTSILTAPAAGQLTAIHDRMPVLLAPELRDAWLDAEEPADDILPAVLAEATTLADELDLRVVDRAVGNVRNQGPHLVEPADTPASDEPETTLG